MAEPDLTLTFPTSGFAWPSGTVLTRADGETLTLLPNELVAVSLNKVDHSSAGRIATYRSADRILTEIEVLAWHSGKPFCDDVAEIVDGLFDACNTQLLKADFVIRDLLIRGFDEMTINLNLKWMVQSGQIALESLHLSQYLRTVT